MRELLVQVPVFSPHPHSILYMNQLLEYIKPRVFVIFTAADHKQLYLTLDFFKSPHLLFQFQPQVDNDHRAKFFIILIAVNHTQLISNSFIFFENFHQLFPFQPRAENDYTVSQCFPPILVVFNI